MRKAPEAPKIGPPWFRSWCEEILEHLKKITPIQGTGIAISETESGRQINATSVPAPPGEAASATPLPWDLTVVDAGGGNSTVTIHPGSINNFIPSNMFTEFTVSNSGTIFVKCLATTDGKVITALELELDATPAATQGALNSALPATFEHTVGIISEGTGYNIAQKFLTATGSRLFLADKASPGAPGEMAFVEWLVWAIT